MEQFKQYRYLGIVNENNARHNTENYVGWYVAVIFRHSLLHDFAWWMSLLCFFELKQLLWVSFILWCYFSKWYSIMHICAICHFLKPFQIEKQHAPYLIKVFPANYQNMLWNVCLQFRLVSWTSSTKKQSAIIYSNCHAELLRCGMRTIRVHDVFIKTVISLVHDK